MVSETLAQGRVVHRAGSMIVSTAATVVVLTGIISAPALLVGFSPGTPLEGPELPALELGWFPPGPSGTSSSVAGGTAGTTPPAGPADVLARSPAPRPEVVTLQPAAQPEQHVAAPPPAAPAAEQPPVLAALPEAAAVVEEIIASPTVADAQPVPVGAVVQPDEQDTVATNEDDGETDLVPEGDDAEEQTDGTAQNPPWLDTDEPTGLLNLLLRNQSARLVK